MPASVQWENSSKSILVFKFEGAWTLQDYFNVVDQSNALMDSVDHTVNMIIDIRKGINLPTGFLSAIRNVSKHPHRNAGTMALVGMSAYVRLFITMVRRLKNEGKPTYTMHFVSDYDEAYRIFEAGDRPSFPPKLMN